ncbi:MAG TPA: choice-of-anchor X domain-containing protein [Vicinamibacterales bacterium]
MRRVALPSLALVCLFAPTQAFAQSVAWVRTDPLVLPSTATGTVRFEAAVSGSPSRVSLALTAGSIDLHDDGSNGDANAGDGVFTVTVPASTVAAQMQPDDVQRVFVGFLDVFGGATRVLRANVFVDVYTPDIPQVPIAVLAGDVQATDRLVNVVDSAFLTDGNVKRIAQTFYRYYSDSFDFLSIVSTPSRFQNRSHATVSNGVQGIGETRIDTSAEYRSSGRLLGYSRFPVTSLYDGASVGYSHETAHQWVNFLNFAPYASGIPHWPVSSMATGVMGFSIGGSGGEGGSFPCRIVDDGTTVQLFGLPQTESPVFNDVDLYLMGLLPASAVRPQVVFTGVTSPPSCTGQVYAGAVARVGVDAIVAGAGQRVPDASTSPKQFRAATILVSRDGLVSSETMWLYSWLTARAELQASAPIHEGLVKAIGNPFFVATGGRASIDTRLVDSADFSLQPAQATVTVPKGTPATFRISVLPTHASFDQPVSLACGTLPSPLACAFEPSQATPGAAGADVTLTVTTAVPVEASAAAPIGAFITIVALALASARARVRVTVPAIAALIVAGCGGAKTPSPQPAQPAPATSTTYTIAVTGTSGSLLHSTNLTLTVQ